MQHKINIGIIGLGVGEAHIEGYLAHPDCQLYALCDFSEERLSSFKNKYPNVIFYKNASELLTDPNIHVVSIASYDNDHCDQILLGLSQGKHLFIEKPLCLFESEAKKIWEMMQTHPELKVSSNLILRKAPRFQQLKEKVESGVLGKVYHFKGDYNYGRIHKITSGWRATAPYYSAMLGGGIHIIDLMNWILKDPVMDVTSSSNKITTIDSLFQFPDFVTSTLRLKSGAIAQITANLGCVFPHFHLLSLYGTQGTFSQTPQQAHYYTSREPSVTPESIEGLYPGVAKGAFLKSFIDSIIQDKKPEIDCKEIFEALAVCFAIEKSLKSGKRESVNYFHAEWRGHNQ